MPKIQLVLRATALDHARFAERVSELVPHLLARSPEGLKLTFTEGAPPRISVVPLSRTPVALVSVWPALGDVALEPWARAATLAGVSVSAYRVDEAVPVAYARTWSDGERTPGVGLLTMFRRRRGLSDEELIRRWHGGHTPLSISIHPLFGYVRNVVVDATGTQLDAIVEEHFRTRQDVLYPHRLFGGVRSMLPNMVRVGADIVGFIDLASLESFLVVEEWIRTPRAPRAA